MPEAIICLAASRRCFSVTRLVRMYQLFQPMGGVRASVSPQTIFMGRSAWPWPFFARSVTGYSPFSAIAPRMMPVAASSASPAGSPSAANSIGRRPVAGMR